MKLKNSKKLLLISFSTIFFVLFAGICPSICQIAEAKSKSHSCCPDQVDSKSDESCCDSHTDYFDNSSKDHSNQLQFNLIGIVENLIPTIQLINFSIQSFDENPPGIHRKNPLYIIKKSLIN